MIQVQNLGKSFGAFQAVKDISFEVDEGQILVIVGSSGCGKTTTLRCIAGLETATSGTVRINGEAVVGNGVMLPPEKRGIGMMFQSYALWPHMSVFENVAYGLKLKRVPRAEIREQVGKVLKLVGLDGLGDRYPSTLSGGQQQRVALARSVVAEQKVILLDEPLSNLDAKLREEMRNELRDLIKRLRMTAIHITHDQMEAMAIADTLIYMRNGAVEQVGTPRDIYRHPTNRYVADFIGAATFLDGTLGQETAGTRQVKLAEGVVLTSNSVSPAVSAAEVVVAIRPEDLIVSMDPAQGPNALRGVIQDQTFLGDHTEYHIEIGGLTFKLRTITDLAIGAEVNISIDPDRVLCLPR